MRRIFWKFIWRSPKVEPSLHTKVWSTRYLIQLKRQEEMNSWEETFLTRPWEAKESRKIQIMAVFWVLGTLLDTSRKFDYTSQPTPMKQNLHPYKNFKNYASILTQNSFNSNCLLKSNSHKVWNKLLWLALGNQFNRNA